MFVQIEKNKVIAWAAYPFKGCTHEVEVDYNDYTNNPEKYIYDKEKQEIVLNPEYESIIEQREKERISKLSITRGDMFEALILAFNKSKDDIRELILKQESLNEMQKKLYVNRLDEALNFYRAHPAVDLIGGLLGITPDRMDKFFDTNDYKELLPTATGV